MANCAATSIEVASSGGTGKPGGIEDVERQLVGQLGYGHVDELALAQCMGPDGLLRSIRHGLDDSGGVPDREGGKLTSGVVRAEE